MDRFGVGLCLLVFTSLLAAGQVLVAFGFSIKSWPLIFVGRLVFALGGENLIVANSALLADWFKGKELAFAFGINLSFARVFSVVNNLVSPALTTSVGLLFAMWFGAIMCAVSVFSVILTIPIDRGLDKKIKEQKDNLNNWGSVSDQSDTAHRAAHLSNSNNSDRSSSFNERQVSKEKRVSPVAHFASDPKDSDSLLQKEKDQKEVGVSMIKDSLSLPHIFWVLVVICIVVYGKLIINE